MGILTNRKLRRAAVAGLVMATSAALAQTAVLKPVANQAAFDRLEQTPAVSGPNKASGGMPADLNGVRKGTVSETAVAVFTPNSP